MWRLVLLVDTDEPGIVTAASAAKELLEPLYGEVRSITVREDASRLVYAPMLEPFQRAGVPELEHRISRRGRR